MNTTATSRRDFLKSTAGVSAVGALSGTGLVATKTVGAQSIGDIDPLSTDSAIRAKAAAVQKISAAQQQMRETLALEPQRRNADERRYKGQNFYASFHKSLPQDEYGEVKPSAFRQLRRALRNGDPDEFERIDLDAVADRPLANPQGALSFQAAGLDSHATRMDRAPAFGSARTAAEMGEVYWQGLTRDVPFVDFAFDARINAAVTDLNAFSETVGPTSGGFVTPDTLFRGESIGDLDGPFISQFLLKDIPYGPSTIEQRYAVPLAGQDFMLDADSWLAVQRGAMPASGLQFDPDKRYLYNNRALGEYVHTDVLFQAYFNAALILLKEGAGALDTRHPYLAIDNQGAFTSFGGPWLLQLLTFAANLALSGAWYQKWRVHRRLRPEAFGGRAHFLKTAQREYDIHSDILDSAALAQTFSRNGSFFLPMAYPEGSPCHPAYPAGHATVAGACCTVLKAFFDEDYVLRNTVQADATGHSLIPYADAPLTLGGEVNKLASNISLGRDAAGVHYRSDGIHGLDVGEQQAISLLRDCVRTCNEPFEGFKLTKFDGTRITIR
ncbi:MAG: vanadium-dependent haloperoxidase [Gammaproteobacteria bacterium]